MSALRKFSQLKQEKIYVTPTLLKCDKLDSLNYQLISAAPGFAKNFCLPLSDSDD